MKMTYNVQCTRFSEDSLSQDAFSQVDFTIVEQIDESNLELSKQFVVPQVHYLFLKNSLQCTMNLFARPALYSKILFHKCSFE
jgi:hypothetical protein